jgi:hypothetical protein
LVSARCNEGASHPDSNAQFEHINVRVVAAIAAGQPVISDRGSRKHGGVAGGGAGTAGRDAGDRVSRLPFRKIELAALLQSLKEAGFVAGQNVAVQYLYAENQFDQVPIGSEKLAPPAGGLSH